MIAERLVLLAVEHLEQRGRRIAVRIGGQLVYLVEKNKRIHHLRLSQRAYDASGHRADIGLAVAANVSLVAHSAERTKLRFIASATERAIEVFPVPGGPTRQII